MALLLSFGQKRTLLLSDKTEMHSSKCKQTVNVFFLFWFRCSTPRVPRHRRGWGRGESKLWGESPGNCSKYFTGGGQHCGRRWGLFTEAEVKCKYICWTDCRQQYVNYQQVSVLFLYVLFVQCSCPDNSLSAISRISVEFEFECALHHRMQNVMQNWPDANVIIQQNAAKPRRQPHA